MLLLMTDWDKIISTLSLVWLVWLRQVLSIDRSFDIQTFVVFCFKNL